MKLADVKLGRSYLAKISGVVTTVTLVRTNPHGGWDARNEKTGREVRIRSAAKLRGEVTRKVSVYISTTTSREDMVDRVSRALPAERRETFLASVKDEPSWNFVKNTAECFGVVFEAS